MGQQAGERFVIAVDSGGTHTRAACFDLAGALLSTASGPGGSPFHNANSAADVAATVGDCLRAGGLAAVDAVALAAGIAEIASGTDGDDEANAWAAAYFEALPPSCRRVLVNDAVIAHRGALLGAPGVIVVAGTGSMILAITAEGREIGNTWFEHYAGAARHLAMDAVQLILLGADGPEDAGFAASALAHWGVSDTAGLREAVLALRRLDRREIMPRYGRMAPLVTAAADASPLADRALRELARKTARGVHLLARVVAADGGPGSASASASASAAAPVPVALAGSVATDPAFRSRLAEALAAEPAAVATAIAAPALDPLRGAALLAYEAAGVAWDEPLLARLAETAVQNRGE